MAFFEITKTAFVFCITLAVSGGILGCSSSSGDPTPPALPDTSTVLTVEPAQLAKLFPPNDFDAVQKYFDAVGKPSRYMTEYIGLHILQPIAKERLLRDWVPHIATLVEDRGNSVALLVAGTHPAVVHFDKELHLTGFDLRDRAPHDYLWFDAPDVAHLIAALDAFHGAMAARGLSDPYFIPNAYATFEQTMMTKLAASGDRALLTPDPDRSRFRTAGADALLVVPDYRHGDEARYAQILDIVQNETFDWFGIEMYERSMQPEINAFLSEPEGSTAFTDAKKKLLAESWHKFEGEKTPEDNHYFRLLDICRKRNIRVYGLDIEQFQDLWGHGETPFGAMVRNVYWTDGLPPSGRGVLFGGSAHFNEKQPIQGHTPLHVQDFLAPTYRGDKLLAFP